MKYVLLIYQGSTPLPGTKAWDELPAEEHKAIYADYAALSRAPGFDSGLPLGLPEKAMTVRVQDGKTVATQGPYAGKGGAVGGYFILEAEDQNQAVEVAARVPAARLGGAIEIRPAEQYW